MTTNTGLGGIRLLEVAGGVGVAYAAKLFADLGADVLRIEEPDDPVRARPHDVQRWLNTNKRSVRRRPDVLAELATGADIVLHDLDAAGAAAAGLDHATLAARSPAVVVCSITPFGMTGPYAGYAGEELNVIHGASWGFLTPSASTRIDLPPLKAPGHHSTLNVVTVAAAAALAAFERADRTGRGEHVDFSMFAAAARMTETAPATAAFSGADASRVGAKSVVPWGMYACEGGLMQFICVEQAQWESLVRLMGDPEWGHWEVFATNDDRRANSDLLNLYVAEWMASQDVTQLYLDGQAARLCMTPVNTMAQLDADPHFAARRFFATDPDGNRLPGPGFQVDRPWWALRHRAPAPGEHDGEGWRAGRRTAEAAAPGPSGPGRPLEGVRVCDFTWIWAGPFCTQYLAHLGAEVIRLESPEHLCLFRRLPFNPPNLPLTPDTAGVFHTYNSDKRSLGIDLGHPDAREAILRLVASSDVVIENFAVGTMAKLGFGVEDLRRVNPDVIIASLTGYGQNGPSADYMAYGPAGGAFAGLYSATGYEGGDPAETGIAVGDPCTGITAAWAIVAALSARRRHREVARLDVAMVEAVAATVGELWMAYQAEGDSPRPAGNHDPVWAPHNCYPASGEDRWVTIACTSDAAWQALCSVIDPAWAADARFATVTGRKSNEAELDDLIGAWTATLDRWEVCRRLQAAGVAAFPSLSPLDLWGGDPHLEAIGVLERPHHPATGDLVVPGIPWRLADGPNGLRRPAPLLGQHTEEILGELGYGRADIDRLIEAGAVRQGAAPAQASSMGTKSG